MYPHEQLLVKRMAGRPFALVGMNSDRDQEATRKLMNEKKLNWDSFWNGPMGTGGPISSLWNVRGWPTIYILDHKGVIRFMDKRGEALDKVVDQLVEAAEKDIQSL